MCHSGSGCRICEGEMTGRYKGIKKWAAAVLFAAACGLIFTGCDGEYAEKEAQGLVAVENPKPALDIPVIIDIDEDGAGTGKEDKAITVEVSGEETEGEDTSGNTPKEAGDDEETGGEEAGDEGSNEAEDEGSDETGDEDPDEAEEAEDGTGEDGDAEGEEATDDTAPEEAAGPEAVPGSVESISLNPGWTYADYSAINSGAAKLYRAAGGRKGVVIAVNAGHGTRGGGSVKTYCHPDMSPKVTGGSTGAGAVKATAISGGMSFADGTSEASVTLREAQLLRDRLLAKGYDVLMLRDDADVQLDNIARTVIANNTAACHIALHWDGDGLSYDKGCFYISTPDGIKGMEPVASHWQQHEALGKALISGLASKGCKIYGGGSMNIDLTQTSYSTIPSVDIELGNAASAHDDTALAHLADGLAAGIAGMF